MCCIFIICCILDQDSAIWITIDSVNITSVNVKWFGLLSKHLIQHPVHFPSIRTFMLSTSWQSACEKELLRFPSRQMERDNGLIWAAECTAGLTLSCYSHPIPTPLIICQTCKSPTPFLFKNVRTVDFQVSMHLSKLLQDRINCLTVLLTERYLWTDFVTDDQIRYWLWYIERSCNSHNIKSKESKDNERYGGKVGKVCPSSTEYSMQFTQITYGYLLDKFDDKT